MEYSSESEQWEESSRDFENSQDYDNTQEFNIDEIKNLRQTDYIKIIKETQLDCKKLSDRLELANKKIKMLKQNKTNPEKGLERIYATLASRAKKLQENNDFVFSLPSKKTNTTEYWEINYDIFHAISPEFTSDFLSGTSNPEEFISKNVFNAIVEYFYTLRVTCLKKSKFYDFLKIALNYNIEDLVQYIDDNFTDYLNFSNVARIFILLRSNQIETPNLASKCYKYLCNNFEEMPMNFLMKPKRKRDFLYLLSSSSLFAKEEYILEQAYNFVKIAGNKLSKRGEKKLRREFGEKIKLKYLGKNGLRKAIKFKLHSSLDIISQIQENIYERNSAYYECRECRYIPTVNGLNEFRIKKVKFFGHFISDSRTITQYLFDQDPDISDLIFVLEKNDKIYAIKHYIIFVSEYWKSFFNSPERLKLQSTDQQNRVIIKELNNSKEQFMQFLEFCYSGNITNLTLDQGRLLMSLADDYNCPLLKQWLTKWLQNKMKNPDIFSFYICSYLYDFEILHKYCYAHLCSSTALNHPLKGCAYPVSAIAVVSELLDSTEFNISEDILLKRIIEFKNCLSPAEELKNETTLKQLKELFRKIKPEYLSNASIQIMIEEKWLKKREIATRLLNSWKNSKGIFYEYYRLHHCTSCNMDQKIVCAFWCKRCSEKNTFCQKCDFRNSTKRCECGKIYIK